MTERAVTDRVERIVLAVVVGAQHDCCGRSRARSRRERSGDERAQRLVVAGASIAHSRRSGVNSSANPQRR